MARIDALRVCAAIASYVLLFGFLLAYSLGFNLSLFIEGGDTLAPLDPFLFVEKGFYVWEDSVLGRLNVLALIQSVYSLPLALFYLVLPSSLAHFAYWLLLFSFMPSSFFLLAFYLTRRFTISFYGGILYSLNLYTAIIHHTPVYHMLYLQGATPLLLLLAIRYLESRRLLTWHALAYSILYVPLLRVINMYLVYLMFIPVYSYIVLRYYKGRRLPPAGLLKKLAAMAVLVLVASMPYLIVAWVMLSQNVPGSTLNIEYSRRSVESSAIHATLVNVVRSAVTYGWVKQLPETPGLQGFESARIYNSDPLLTLATFYPIILLSLLVVAVRARGGHARFIALSLGVMTVLLFFMKMVNPPLGSVNRFLYDNVPFFLVLFRSAWKYLQVPYLLVLALTVVAGLRYAQERLGKTVFKTTMIIIAALHLVYIYPAVLASSKLVNSAWIVDVPQDYLEVSGFLNSRDEPFRVMPLPQSMHPTGYLVYTWGYGGPDLLYTLLYKPMIDKYHNPVLPNWTLGLVGKLERLSYSDIDSLVSELRLLNVKYVIVRKSVDTENRYIRAWGDPREYASYLESRPDISKVMETENFIVYELSSYCPRIWAVSLESWESQDGGPQRPPDQCGYGSPGNTRSVEKLNPTTWRVRVDVSEPSIIVFAEAFDPLWEATVYAGGTIVDRIGSTMVYGALNGFKINHTGSITLEIRYKPQKLFIASIIASVLILTSLALYPVLRR